MFENALLQKWRLSGQSGHGLRCLDGDTALLELSVGLPSRLSQFKSIFARTNLRLLGLLFRHINLLMFSFNNAVIPIVNVEIGVD